MKTLNFDIKNPSALWNQLLQYHEIPEGETEFQLKPKYGVGHFSFKRVGTNIKHLNFRLSYNETTRFNFFFPEDKECYKVIIFYKGKAQAIKYINQEQELENKKALTQIKRVADRNLVLNSNMLSQFNKIPNFILEKDEVCSLDYLFLRQKWLDEIIPENLLLNFQQPIITTKAGAEIHGLNKVVSFDKLFSKLKEFHDTNYADKLTMLGDLYKILGDYFYVVKLLKFTNNKEEKKNAKVNDKDFQAILKIEQELGRLVMQTPPTLESLAETYGLSKTKMCNMFKDFYGKAIHAYYNDLKLTKAKELLDTTDLTISEIGMKLTIPNQSYFTKWFKKQTGLSPKDYRYQF